MNTALSECVPLGSVVMVRAKPPDIGTGVPSVVVPSMNWMVPVAPRGATLARKITGKPWKAGVGNTLSVVVEAVAPLGAVTT